MSNVPPDELMRGTLLQADFDRVLKWLRQAGSEERVAFIGRWSHLTPGSRLATSAINHPAEAFNIAYAAFDAIHNANSSRTKLWCQFAVTKLGARKTIRLLREFFETRPHVVDMACYWLPRMISHDSPGYGEMQSLCRDADAAGIIRPTVTSKGADGQTLYHDRYGSSVPKN